MKRVKDRFLRYLKTDTQSDSKSNSTPSTQKQFDLALKLKKELEDIGLKGINLSKQCYLTATLPSNIDHEVPTIAFIAHLDTSPDASGKNVKPQIIEDYNGEDITLCEEDNIILSPERFPALKNYVGKTLITTDGKTLLGADDKAGIAEIVTAVNYLVEHPEIEHGKIKIAFTPDEEIGRGADFFDVEKFDADYAFTIDGGEIGELEYENFNAAFAEITVSGLNVHPGNAKNKMLNSMQIAMDLHEMLPENQRPESTENYEGFYHLINMCGNVEKTTMQYIIRDHDKKEFETKKVHLIKSINTLNQKYGNRITIDLKDQYYNMKQKIEPVFHIIEKAKIAYQKADVQPNIVPIRGGTDGARLSYDGLPCPNIFTGGHNFHGKYEYIPVESMIKAVEVIVNLANEFTKENI